MANMVGRDACFNKNPDTISDRAIGSFVPCQVILLTWHGLGDFDPEELCDVL